ncbi:hypothetical protein [Nocardioides montaniterrae]
MSENQEHSEGQVSEMADLADEGQEPIPPEDGGAPGPGAAPPENARENEYDKD